MKVYGFFYVLLSLVSIGEGNGSGVESTSLPFLWSLKSASIPSNRRRLIKSELTNRRLASLKNVEELVFKLSPDAVDSIAANKAFHFELPTTETVGKKRSSTVLQKTCVVKEGNPLVPLELVENYPEIKHFRCLTDDGEVLTITHNSESVDGFSAAFFTKDRKSYYIDSAVNGTDEYVIYDTEQVFAEGTPPEAQAEEVIRSNNTYFEETLKKLNKIDVSRSASTTIYAHKFKIAVIANSAYSNYHGNTKASVLAAIVTAFTRVNGIYMRELGVYFQLISKNDALICLKGSSDSDCNSLSNSWTIINQAKNFIAAKGISSSSYDIGHSVTTGSGGLAEYPSICSSTKERGTTGLSNPTGDPFYVDYVSHEVGHQVYGPHSFRDCAGEDDGNLMLEGAIEPGSGSSIMGYAGICGKNNLQTNSDPYFPGLILRQIHEYISAVSCGTKYSLTAADPTLTVADSCQVPIGNYFQLKGASSAANNAFFSWDRVDTGYEDFDSTTSGRFRSWRPTASMSRFFPNLHYLNFDSSQKVEQLPTIQKTMKFQFTQRSLFDSDATAASMDMDLVGHFTFKTTAVQFVDAAGLSLVAPASGSTFSSGEEVTVMWTKPAFGSSIQVWIAEMILVDDSSFRYDQDMADFEWKVVGAASASDTQLSFALPTFEKQTTLNIIVASSTEDDFEGCFFFDIATQITVLGDDSTAFPSVSPTKKPTKAPTRRPTSFPVVSPTESPTLTPTRFPSVAPTTSRFQVSPTPFPVTMNPTPFPTTASPTSFPSNYPTPFPSTAAPTNFPSE